MDDVNYFGFGYDSLENFFLKRKILKIFKKITLCLLVLSLLGVAFIGYADARIESEAEPFITSDLQKLPKEKTGLLLGTSKTLSNGSQNTYFTYRIDAAVKLFKAGKIQNIIVSGNNSVEHYNEPKDMKLALIAAGIPEKKIFEDFAGFRTLDSVVRAKEIFGQKSYIIISQKFHNERAVFIARKNGIDALGYNAIDVNSYFGFKTNMREYLARVKVFVDFLTHKKPKFKGQKIQIP